MKIQEVTLNNIGPYIGENAIAFNTVDATKNIVLIGGRNGAGKTTLFDAMKICLYGYKLYGYRQNSQVYTGKVKKLINDNTKRTPIPKAGVILSIFIEDGYANNTFTISRCWDLHKDQLKETYLVQKNGILLSYEEQTDFDNYLLQTIPPALFNFHFFNGEDIAAFLFDKETGQSFRKAFMQICGLDTLDLIQEQLQSNIHVHSKENDVTIQKDYFEKKAQKDQLSSRLSDIITELDEAESAITHLEEKSALLEQETAQYGGVQSHEWQLIQDQIKAEESLREETHRYLKDIANNILPFLILENELTELRHQIQIESSIMSNRAIQDQLLKEDTRTLLNSRLLPYLKTPLKQLENDFFQALFEAVKSDCPENASEFLKLSEREQHSILSKIENYLTFDKEEIIKAEKRIKKSLSKTKRLRAKADSKEVLSSESYLSNAELLRQQLADTYLIKHQANGATTIRRLFPSTRRLTIPVKVLNF